MSCESLSETMQRPSEGELRSASRDFSAPRKSKRREHELRSGTKTTLGSADGSRTPGGVGARLTFMLFGERGSSPGMIGNAGAQGADTNAKVFADADALKQQAHKDIDKKEHDVSVYYKEHGCMQKIARSSLFGNVTLVCIFVNSLWIGLEMDTNKEEQLSEAAWYFQVGEYFFFAFFSFEWIVRFGAFKHKCDGFRDKWFCFDSGLVFLMVGETALMPLILAIVRVGSDSDAGDEGTQDLSQLAMLRMFRLLRLTRMVRFMRSVPELVTLLKSMTIALRSVVSTLALLTIFMYIFSIIFKSQLKTDEGYLEDKFGRIAAAMWTLLLTGTFMDNLSICCNQLLNASPLLTMLFMAFIFLSSFTVLNMLIGLLCEVVTAVAASEKEKTVVTYVKSRLLDVLEQLDVDKSASISKAEFDELVTIPEAVQALNELGVDVPNLVSLSDHLFEADEFSRHGIDAVQRKVKYQKSMPFSESTGLASMGGTSQSCEPSTDSQAVAHGTQSVSSETDLERSEGSSGSDSEMGVSLSFADFLEMVIRLRADNRPSVLDIVDLRKLVLKSQRQVLKQVDVLEQMNATLSRDMQAVTLQLDRFCRWHRETLLRGVAKGVYGKLMPLTVHRRPFLQEVHRRPLQLSSLDVDTGSISLATAPLPQPPLPLEPLDTGDDDICFQPEDWDMARESESGSPKHGSHSPPPGSVFTITSGATAVGAPACSSTAATASSADGATGSAPDPGQSRSAGKGVIQVPLEASPLAALIATAPHPTSEHGQIAAQSGDLCDHPPWAGDAEVSIQEWDLPVDSPLQPLTASSQEQPGTAFACTFSPTALPSEFGEKESTVDSSVNSTS